MNQQDFNIPIASAEDISNVLRRYKPVPIPKPLPHLTILIHGVNDVGEAYQAQDEGLCRGLNARLNRSGTLDRRDGDLLAADYNMSFAKKLADLEKIDGKAAQKLRSNPDSILYRRAAVKGTWSPVIPFYWGFREETEAIVTTEWHGEWLDRHGNRLDKNGSKGGGPFVNATNNLADLWAKGWGWLATTILDEGSRDPWHPKKVSPERRYFVLAALRLASLIEMIRKRPETRNTAINIMGHSQGYLITLLAQALLKEWSVQPADCLILQNPPYSLEQTQMDRMLDSGDQEQTVEARLKTLTNIVGFVTGQRQTSPAFDDALRTQYMERGVAGKYWQPAAGAQRCIGSAGVTFAERDNRGKVYLYFTDHDKTVSLRNIQGIGWQGVPDELHTFTGFDRGPQSNNPRWARLPAMNALKDKRFFQRVFTEVKPNGQPELVGGNPNPGNYRYALRRKGEGSPTGGVGSASVSKEVQLLINGETLTPPCAPRLGEAKLPVDYIEASIGLTSGFLDGQRGTVPETVADPRHSASWSAPLFEGVKQQIQNRYDREAEATGYPAENRKEVTKVSLGPQPGTLYVLRRETPNEMKERLTKTMTAENSFHSGIPANRDHHEQISAYDLALGKLVPPILEISGWLPYLRAVADWRTEWQKMRNNLRRNPNPEHQRMIDFLDRERSADAKALIDATDIYYSTGELPPQVAAVRNVSLLISQTTTERGNNVPPHSFRVPA
jgi:hypothetical protein